MNLTYKQEQFCKNIVSGLNGTDSYIKAYNCKSKSAANIESTKLLKRDDITAYITELKKPLQNLYQNQIISDRKKQIDFINERIEICKTNNDEQSIIRYTDMLNKILALYKDTEQPSEQQNNINNIDTDTLKKLTAVKQ